MFGFGNNENTVKARIEDLRPGHFIELQGGWFAHDFVRSKFLIESPRVIDELRAANIKTVLVHLDKSTIPFPAPPDIDFERPAAPPAGASTPPTPTLSEARSATNAPATMQEALQRGSEMRRRQEAAEAAHAAALQETQFVMNNMLAPGAAVAERTRAFVGDAVSTVMSDDATLHLLSSRQGEMSLRFHSLQVMTLSLLTGKRLELSETELQDLATAALFHDAGIGRLQDSVRMSAGGGSRIE